MSCRRRAASGKFMPSDALPSSVPEVEPRSGGGVLAYMQWETTVRYECPHCRAALGWDHGAWRGWVLCPSCGRSGRPPAPRLVLPAFATPFTKPAAIKTEQGEPAAAASGEGPPRWSRDLESIRRNTRASARLSTIRAVAGVGLASSLFVMLVGYLDQNSTVASTAAVTALMVGMDAANIGRELMAGCRPGALLAANALRTLHSWRP